jgi:geranylgeranyl pyrophosphate synthase
LTDADASRRHELRPYLESSGALAYAWERAKQHCGHATAALDVLPESAAKATLRSLASYVVRRSS